MQISDDLRKAVVFLGEDITGPDGEPDIDPKGTGFMVTWKSDSSFAFPKGLPVENESAGIYLVTAKHLAEWHKSTFVIRFNKKGGGSGIESFAEPHWHYHPDETVDVAVLHCGRPDWADCVMVPGGLFVTPAKYMTPSDVISNDPHIGIGDITYVVGLFHFFTAKKLTCQSRILAILLFFQKMKKFLSSIESQTSIKRSRDTWLRLMALKD